MKRQDGMQGPATPESRKCSKPVGTLGNAGEQHGPAIAMSCLDLGHDGRQIPLDAVPLALRHPVRDDGR